MLRETYISAAQELMESLIRRETEFRNSAMGQLLDSVERQMSDPIYQMTLRETESAAVRAVERSLWYYRRTTGVLSRIVIRKVVNKLIERLGFTKKFDPESFANRIEACLAAQEKCDGIVKVHSPPVRLIPKTLHPINSVA